MTQLRKARGWDNQTLFNRAGLSESYYYVRMRGDAPWSLNDVEKLATAFAIHWMELFRIAAIGSETADSALEPMIQVDPHELSVRVHRLVNGLRSSGSSFEWLDLQSAAEAEGVALSEEQFRVMENGSGSGEVSARVAAILARFWDIPEHYLTDFDDEPAADMAEALLEFRLAMKETGAVSISARSLGAVTPEALRAITRTLRSVG